MMKSIFLHSVLHIYPAPIFKYTEKIDIYRSVIRLNCL